MLKTSTDLYWNERATKELDYKAVNIADSAQRKLETEFLLNHLTKEDNVLEGIGCWHATFPAENIHINLLASAAMDIINNYIPSEKGLAVVIQRNGSPNSTRVEIMEYKDDYD